MVKLFRSEFNHSFLSWSECEQNEIFSLLPVTIDFVLSLGAHATQGQYLIKMSLRNLGLGKFLFRTYVLFFGDKEEFIIDKIEKED